MKHKPLYAWEGHSLLMDTIVYRKRIVSRDDEPIRYCPFDVRRFVMPPEDEVMGKTWERLARAHRANLEHTKGSQRHDIKAKAVWNHVVEHIHYHGEPESHDKWQFPQETLQLGHGDCEDKSFLCASLLLAAGIPAARVRVVVGVLVSDVQSPRNQGHAWPMYQNARGVWCILEPNIPHLPVQIRRTSSADIVVPARAPGIRRSVFLPADRLATAASRERYVPLICFNHRSVWSVEPRVAGTVQVTERFAPDWSKNPTFDQILKWAAKRLRK